MDAQKIDKKKHDLLNNFIAQLRQTYLYNLVSVILYGSGASQEFSDSHSDLNLLVILKSADMENLKPTLNLLNRPVYRRIRPLFLTEDYINKSCDVFPIEFLDMKENHLLLFGKDVLEGVNIDVKNLRFQCEHELKTLLFGMKHAYLKIGNDKVALRNLLFKSFTSSLHILRNVLRLKGKAAPYQKMDILREMANELHMGIDIWKDVLAARNDALELGGAQTEALFFKFVSELEKVINIVDMSYA